MLYHKRACYGCEHMGHHHMMEDHCCGEVSCGCGADPIIEAPVEKCIKRDFFHEVPHVCPVHTRVINNHIFKHTYVPHYTCSEENVMCNIDHGSCCNY